MTCLLALALLLSRSPSSLAETPAEFEAARARILAEARLDAFVRNYGERVRTGGDLAKVFSYGPHHRYQREWTELSRANTPLPKITREGLTLKLAFAGTGDVRVDFKDFAQNRVLIEGIPWTFDPSAPPRLQAELLQAKLRAAVRDERHAGFALWNELFPSAEAQMPQLFKPAAKPSVIKAVIGKLCGTRCTIFGSVVTAAGIINGNVQDTTGKTLCYFNYSLDIKWPFKAGFCTSWLETHENTEKRERERAVANWGALKGQVKWISDPNPKCMNKDAKGAELYSFNMTEVAQDASAHDKVFFTGKGSNGLLSDAAVYKSEEDARAPDAASRALAQFIFTEDPKQTAAGVPPALSYVRVLDEQAKPAADGDRHTMVDLSRRPKDVPLAVTDRVFRYVAMISSAQKWLIACQAIAESAKLNPAVVENTVKTIITNEKNKPLNPQPEDAVGTTR